MLFSLALVQTKLELDFNTCKQKSSSFYSQDKLSQSSTEHSARLQFEFRGDSLNNKKKCHKRI